MQTRRALIMVAGTNCATMHVARSLGQQLRRRGHDAHVADAGMTIPESLPGDYSAVVFGTESGYSRNRRELAAYIARHRSRLDAMPTGLFVVANPIHRDPQRQVETFASALRWRPKFATFVPARDRLVRSAAQRMVCAMLGSIVGSRHVAPLDELSTFADEVARELSCCRPVI